MGDLSAECVYRRGLNTLIKCEHTSKKLVIPEKLNGHPVEAIGIGAFLNDALLEEIILPNTVTRIEDSAFQGCSALQRVQLPEKLSMTGSFVFADCDALEEISLPDSLQIISYGCFSTCTSLSRVSLPASLRIIANRAFEECRALTQLDLPKGITAIGNAAFYNCLTLNMPRLPESLNSIGNSAFYRSPLYAPAYDTVSLPAGLALLGTRAFRCRQLNIPGQTELDALSPDIEEIFAPQLDPEIFMSIGSLSAACRGFAEMTDAGQDLNPTVCERYRELITENAADLYDTAAKAPSLLRYMLRISAVPCEDIPQLLALCSGRVEQTAELLRYSAKFRETGDEFNF